MRVFLDTNVIVSALVARGLCEDLFREVLADHELLTSEVVLDELERVLRLKLAVPVALVNETLTLLRQHSVVPRPAAPLNVEISDPDDAWILASAVDSHADILVTGDRDLLDLGDRAPLPVTDPRGFWTLLRNQRK